MLFGQTLIFTIAILHLGIIKHTTKLCGLVYILIIIIYFTSVISFLETRVL